VQAIFAYLTHDRLMAILGVVYAASGFATGHLSSTLAIGIGVAALGGVKWWTTRPRP
jgi:hypothetical protein